MRNFLWRKAIRRNQTTGAVNDSHDNSSRLSQIIGCRGSNVAPALNDHPLARNAASINAAKLTWDSMGNLDPGEP